jgi:heterogeneous nuclear rnp K-like protein 2
MIGLIVGTKASTLKEIQRKCSVMVRIPPQNEVDPGALDRDLRVVGTEEGISAARDMISKILDDGYLSQVNSQRQQSGTPPAVNDHDFRHERSQVPSDFGIHPSRQEYHRETRRPGYGGMEDRPVYRYLMTDIPREYASLIIGKSGERIQNMRRMTNCKITVEHLVEMSDRTQKFKISGTDEDLSKCVQMINDLLVQHDYTPIDFENQTNPRHLQDLKPLEVVQQQIHQQFQQSLQQQMLARSEPGQVSPPPAHRDAVEEFSAGW